MEKKLKINFILKVIAVFAFVAFCLLAILAGVTLPFVSNASVADSAVVSSESDYAVASADNTINYDNFTATLSDCNTTDTYYGFYITEEFYNFVKAYNFEDGVPIFFGSVSFNNSDNDFLFYCSGVYDSSNTLKFKVFSYTYDFENYIYLFKSDVPYSAINRAVIFNQGFKFQTIYSDNQSDEEHIPFGFKDKIKVFTSLTFGGDTSDLENQIATLTAEKNALQTQVNNLTDENNNLKNSLGFKSRFGYIGDLKNNQMFLNLRAAPIIPDDIYCPYRNDTLVNYKKIVNDYYLSIVDAYDSNNNVVTDSFSGWKFINIKNPDGTSSNFYDFEFFIRDLRIAHIDTVEFVNNCFSTPNYNHIYYLVSTDFLDANYAAYGSSTSLYLYSLCSYLTKDDVRDFFALFDLTYYIPVNDAFYLNGYNNASKGYFDDGYNQGYSIGKGEGYNTGFSAGDSAGFARGVESANTYSFLGLFGAIFDAPIKAIFGGTSTLPAGTTITDSNGNTITLQSTTTVNRAGLLNFNLMGVNLSGFVLALFSLSILVVVIKFALAKGR